MSRPDAADVPPFLTAAGLAADLERLGVVAGDMVMVHAAMGRVGDLIGGPDTLIDALLSVVGSAGTLIGYTDWNARYEDLLDADGRVPDAWRPHIPPFDPLSSRAIRHNGTLQEFLRTRPGARRSASPGPSVTAIGARADDVTADHPIDYGYGPGSPLAKLVAAGGKVAMIGAPLDTMTLLHHAEHLAAIPGKRIRRYEVPFATPGVTEWRMVEEFDTGDPVVDGLDEDYFATIVEAFLASGQGARGMVGRAPSVLVDAAAITEFAVRWLEAEVPG
ncbi:aminoglycoside 3-N-acetyltransferase [Sphingomonas sp. HF-S3]|uniref:Aminoglycoside N(3)-acetyltransferase n=1 Tax=Sphingomonas rustica TaxID=3103142 RepID=A0ABV0B4F0_9SPHN